MEKIQNSIAYLFIGCVAILAVISVFGVWNLLDDDVISKSFKTIGLIAFASIIIAVAGNASEKHKLAKEGSDAPEAPGAMQSQISEAVPHKAFAGIRQTTTVFLVVCVSILALLGALSIWEVMGGEILERSFSSMIILSFAAFIIVLTCLTREKIGIFSEKKHSSPAILVFIVLIVWFIALIASGF
ncbi:MAG: hypothetical protein COV70_01440 [Parcubacteria group bacterium CG11_big_fil_rev_8_21_14_0_20_39_22]|nr:MAG: hypothetical protein COV70_01440 [Parcubacteria group bacterium CG11_big_fil_rev_8_21_14_0_20_39_22]